MKPAKILAAALILIPVCSFAEDAAPEVAVVDSPERCITASSGVTETSKQLKDLSAEMGWDLGSFKAMKVSGVVKGRVMASKEQVDVCMKDFGTELKYQVRVGAATAETQEWEVLSDDKL